MDEHEWASFLAGGEPIAVSVGRLAHDLAKSLGSATNLVQIRHDYAIKCQVKHRLSPAHFVLLPTIIELGAVVQDVRRPMHLTVLFAENFKLASAFEVALKSSKLGHELHVCSFHKTRVSEYNRQLRKHLVLRHQKD